MSFFYYSNNNNNNSSSSLNISSNNKIDNDNNKNNNNSSSNNSSINQEEANKGGSKLEILKTKPRMVLERLKNMSKHMRSVTPTTATSSPSPTPSQSTYGGLYYQDREPIARERSDSKYYLNKYRSDVKKFEEDRKKAIRDFEKNRVARTIAIITQGSVTSPVQMHSKKKTKTVIDMEKGGDKKDSDKKDKDKKDDDNKSEKPERKRDQFKDKFVEWTSYSTAHGIPNIFRLESQLLKIIWILCFLASFAYCSYTIVNIVIVFLQYGVLINQEVVSEAPVDFPAVTVCNLNAFDKRHAQNYINQVLAANNISYVSNINLIDIPPTQVNNLIKASIIGNTSFSKADIQYMGFSIDYMLLTCYFNNVPCNQSDFRWIYDFDYTNCWQFNSGYDQYGNKVPIRQVNEAGADRSLNLELFIGDDATQSQYMLNSGARVVVHNQSVAPIISSEGIDIATGFKTNVAFRRSFLSRLDAPYSDCIKDTSSPDSFESVYYKAIFNTLNMTTYRQKVCFRICLQEYILSECSCIDGSLPNIYKNTNNESSVNVCQTVSLLNCVSNARIEYFSNQNSTLSIECATKHCPLECDSESIEMTTSSSRYPTQYYQGYMSAHTNILSKFLSTVPPELTKTTVYLSVFFDDIATTYTEEIPAITGSTLLGTIGGNLGLFIGASLLTFVEIVELLIEFLFIAFKIHF